jgi:surface polysaccharide O-acyltransferase-like enzyme
MVGVLMLVGFHAISGDLAVTSLADSGTVLAVLRMALFAGLPVLFLVSGYVNGELSPPRDVRHLRRRVLRLVRLLVIWSVIYGVLSVIQDPAQLEHPRALLVYWLSGLPVGRAFGHLWFLAALAECVLLDYALSRARLHVRGKVLTGLLLFVASLTVSWVAPDLRFWIDRTFVSWYAFYALGGPLISVASKIARRRALFATAIVALAALVLLFAVSAVGLQPRDVVLASTLVTAVLGTGIAVLFGTDGAGLRWAPRDSRIALGIYLIHPMALALGASTMAQLTQDAALLSIVRFSWALSFAWSLCWLIERSKRASALLL